MNGDDERAPLTPQEEEAEYRRLHSRDGYLLGSARYPDNREGRRALARTWRRLPVQDQRW